MKRVALLLIAAALGLQPALADGLTPKAKRELAARNGPAFNDPEYNPATTSRMFRVSNGPSSLPPGQVASRIKDLAQLQSSRDNQLVGYGLVIGLAGSGDSLRNSPFTEQSIRAMLENLGIATEGGSARAKNVAAVIVTANMPPYVQSGSRIDVSVSSMGDATSLAGGTLVMTPLKAADGEIYAVGQGSVIVSGFNAQGQAEQLTQGVPTSGRVPNGAIVERAVDRRGEDVAVHADDLAQEFDPEAVHHRHHDDQRRDAEGAGDQPDRFAPERGRQDAARHCIGERIEKAAAEALDRASDKENRHARRERGDQRSGAEGKGGDEIGAARPEGAEHARGDRRGEDRGDDKQRRRPGIGVEAADILHDGRHHRPAHEDIDRMEHDAAGEHRGKEAVAAGEEPRLGLDLCAG